LSVVIAAMSTSEAFPDALKRLLRAQPVEAGVALTRALLLREQHRLQAGVVLSRGGGVLSKVQLQNLIRSCLEYRVGRGCAAVLWQHELDARISEDAGWMA
jgi:hypothetical protein